MESGRKAVDVIGPETNVSLLQPCERSGRQPRRYSELRLSQTSKNTQVRQVHFLGIQNDQIAHFDPEGSSSASKGIDLRVGSINFPRPNRPNTEIGIACQISAAHTRLLANAPHPFTGEASHNPSTQRSTPSWWIRLTETHSARPRPLISSNDVLKACLHMTFYFDSLSLAEGTRSG